jgi:DNA-binding transcriptional MerR regulator
MAPSSYSIDELAAACGVTPRAIRYYVQKDILPAPTFRGSQTRYSAEHRLRLDAIRYLRKVKKMKLAAIRRQIAKLDVDQLAALLPPPPPAPPPPAVASAGVAIGTPANATASAFGAGWSRLVLVPGLEVHLAADASALARRIARDIAEARWPKE